MENWRKVILGNTYVTNLSLNDVRRKDILEAAEDEENLYLITRIPHGDPKGEQVFWAVDKKTGKVRSGGFPSWCMTLAAIEEKAVTELKPPFDKLSVI